MSKVISLDEVAKHASVGDAWIAIDGGVYDVSVFMRVHPGSQAALERVAGTDCTEEFYSLHRASVLDDFGPKLLVGRVAGAPAPAVRDPGALSEVPFAEYKSPFETPQHDALRREVREFVEAEISPNVDAWEAAGKYPQELVKKMGALGLIAGSLGPGPHLAMAPRVVGGMAAADFDYTAEKIVHEELKRCGSWALIDGIGGGTVIGCPPVLHFGSPALVQKVVPQIMTGEKRICLAITDPYAGSDGKCRAGLAREGRGGVSRRDLVLSLKSLVLSLKSQLFNSKGGGRRRAGGMRDSREGKGETRDSEECKISSSSQPTLTNQPTTRTNMHDATTVASTTATATLSADGSHYIVSGQKKWITGGMSADYFTTAVRTGGKGHGGISVLLIERDDDVETKVIKTNYSTVAGTALVTFNDVKVPVGNLLGEENNGFKVIMKNFSFERWAMAVGGNRQSRLIVEECFKWAYARKVFGKRLIFQPQIQEKLSQMVQYVESVAAWIDSVTHQMDSMASPTTEIDQLAGVISMLKNQQVEASRVVADNALQIFGGRGFTKSGLGSKLSSFLVEHRYGSILGGADAVLATQAIRQTLKAMPKNARL